MVNPIVSSLVTALQSPFIIRNDAFGASVAPSALSLGARIQPTKPADTSILNTLGAGGTSNVLAQAESFSVVSETESASTANARNIATFTATKAFDLFDASSDTNTQQNGQVLNIQI